MFTIKNKSTTLTIVIKCFTKLATLNKNLFKHLIVDNKNILLSHDYVFFKNKQSSLVMDYIK